MRSARLGSNRPKEHKQPIPQSEAQPLSSLRIGYLSMTDLECVIAVCRIHDTSSNTPHGFHRIVIDDIVFAPLDKPTLLERMLEIQEKWRFATYYCDTEDYELFSSEVMQIALMNIVAKRDKWFSITPVEREADLARRHATSYVGHLERGLFILNPELLRQQRMRAALNTINVKGVADAVSGATEILHATYVVR